MRTKKAPAEPASFFDQVKYQVVNILKAGWFFCRQAVRKEYSGHELRVKKMVP